MVGIHKYIVVFFAGLILGLAAMYAMTTRGEDRTMPPGLASAPTHTVYVKVPLVVQDKPAAKDAGAISSATAKDPDKEVLQTGEVKTSDGKKTVAAVLDTKTGGTSLVEHGSFAEWLSRHEVGIGVGLVDGDLARAAQYRYTFARLWRIYGTVQAEAFQVERLQERNPWNVMLYVSYRW